MTPVFTIHGRGTVRLTICLGPWALKLARNARGVAAIVLKPIYGPGPPRDGVTCFAQCLRAAP